MKKELDEKLVKDFPKIFKGRYGNIRETLMPFGFECGDGWYPILNVLCRAIQRRIDKKDRYFKEVKKSFYQKWKYKFNEIKRLFGWIWWILISNEPWGERKIPQVVATQVKEKFGGLRFYYDGGDGEIDGMVSFAESLCDITCEYCGSNEDVRQTRTGWIKTMCKICRDADKIYNLKLCTKCADKIKLQNKLRG